MCFDIDVTQHTTEVLSTYFDRITRLLNQRGVVLSLPDHGVKLRYVRRTLIKEINFREDLGLTMSRVIRSSVKSSSDTQLDQAMSVRKCSINRRIPEHRPIRQTGRSLPPVSTDSAPIITANTTNFDLPPDVSAQKQLNRRSKSQRLAAKERRQVRERGTRRETRDESAEFASAFDGATGHVLQRMVQRYVMTGELRTVCDSQLDEPQPGPSGLQNQNPIDQHRREENGVDSDDEDDASGGRHFMQYGGDEEGGSSHI